jgi:S-adenosylmethionine decarboxylase proenzyme
MSINIRRGPPVGTHLIVNLYDIMDRDLLSHIWRGKEVLSYVIDKLNLHIVGETGHQFQPDGYTIIFALSESHLSIHTYPEYNSAYLDIFCCNPSFNSIEAYKVLKEAFETETATHTIIRR